MENFTLYISDAAVARVLEVTKNKPENTFLRVEVIPGGCQGFNTRFSLDREIKESDIVFAKDGVTFVSDNLSLDIINNSTIEFSSSLMGKHFWLNVKSAKNKCSCGSSFSI